MTIKHLVRTEVTPSSKAKTGAVPQVGRAEAVLTPSSGNNSVSKGYKKVAADQSVNSI